MGENEDKVNDADIAKQTKTYVNLKLKFEGIPEGNALAVGYGEVTKKLEPVPQGKKWNVHVIIIGEEVDA